MGTPSCTPGCWDPALPWGHPHPLTLLPESPLEGLHGPSHARTHPARPRGPHRHPSCDGLHGQPQGAAKPGGDRGTPSHPPTAGHQLDHQLGVGDVGAAHGGPAHTGTLLGVHAGHGVWGTEAGDMQGPLMGPGPAQRPLPPLAPPSTGADIDPSLWPRCPDLGRGPGGEAGSTSRMEIHLCLPPASVPPHQLQNRQDPAQQHHPHLPLPCT